jgi:hypothetical protein
VRDMRDECVPVPARQSTLFELALKATELASDVLSCSESIRCKLMPSPAGCCSKFEDPTTFEDVLGALIIQLEESRATLGAVRERIGDRYPDKVEQSRR